MIRSDIMCDSDFMENESLLSPADRLLWAREKAGYETAADFARAINMKSVTYRSYESGQNGFARHSHQFADKLGVTSKWLMQGGMLPTAPSPDVSLESLAKDVGMALIPQLELGYSMGGGSIFNEYQQTGFIPFQRDWLKTLMRGSFDDLFVARGSGDSMLPTLMDGDIVLIDTSQRRISAQDQIWAISYGELGMIKRVRRTPLGSYLLMSDNPAISVIDAADEEMHVVGKIIWLGRRM